MSSMSSVNTDDLAKEFKDLLTKELCNKFKNSIWGVDVAYNGPAETYYLYLEIVPITKISEKDNDNDESNYKQILRYVEDKYGLVNGKMTFNSGFFSAFRYDNLGREDLMWMIVVNKLSA